MQALRHRSFPANGFIQRGRDLSWQRFPETQFFEFHTSYRTIPELHGD